MTMKTEQQIQQESRRAVERRLSKNDPTRTYKCVGLTEDRLNATVEVHDTGTNDDFTINCRILWRSDTSSTIDMIGWFGHRRPDGRESGGTGERDETDK